MQRRTFLKAAMLGAGALSLGTFAFETACATPAWVITAEGIAEAVVPIAASIVTIVDPPIGPLVTLVEDGFTAVMKALQDYQNAMNNGQPTASFLQVIQTAFSTLATDAANLLNAFGASGQKDAVINAIIQLIAQAVADIGALLPKTLTKKILLSPALFPIANGWKGRDFKERYNAKTHGDPRFRQLSVL